MTRTIDGGPKASDPIADLFLDANALVDENIDEIIRQRTPKKGNTLTPMVVDTSNMSHVEWVAEEELEAMAADYVERINQCHARKQYDQAVELVLKMMGEGIHFAKIKTRVPEVEAIIRLRRTRDEDFGRRISMVRTRCSAIVYRRKALSESKIAKAVTGQHIHYGMVLYDQTIADIICYSVVEGELVSKVIEGLGMSRKALDNWVTHVPAFADQLATARKTAADAHVDHAFEIIDNADVESKAGVLKAKIQSELRMKYAALVHRARYGDNRHLTVSGKVDHVAVLNNARKNVETKREALISKIDGEVVPMPPLGD